MESRSITSYCDRLTKTDQYNKQLLDEVFVMSNLGKGYQPRPKTSAGNPYLPLDYWILLYDSVSQGLGTTKCMNSIG